MFIRQSSASQRMSAAPVASTLPGNLSEMQILRPYPGITELEPLRLGLPKWVLTSLSGDAHLLQLANLSSREWQCQHVTE